MKKIYLSPTTKVVEVELQHIMAGSLNGLTDEGGTMDLADESADDGADAWSRRRRNSEWEDEEEDEYDY